MENPDTVVVNYPADRIVRHLEVGLKSGGGGGTYDGMEARIKTLEYRADAIDSRLGRIEDKLDRAVEGIARIEGRLSDMPTRGFVIMTVAAIVGLVLAAIAVAPYLRVPA